MSDYETATSTFRKSSFSESGNCVEVASGNGTVMVRDSKLRDVEIIPFPPVAWREFIRAVRLNVPT